LNETLPPSALPCPNCGDEVEGNYCRICGQRKTEHRASVPTLLRDAFDDQFSLVTELPRTLHFLFTRPGFLTSEYAAGRIARYIAPLRLYLAASVIFFLALSFRASHARITVNGQPIAADSTHVGTAAAARDSIGNAFVDSLKRTPDAQLNESQRCIKHAKVKTRFCTPSRTLNDFMAPRLVRLDSIPKAELATRMRSFLVQRTPTVIFLLLPVFALLLKLLYWRSRKYYAEHFVFSLHVHSFLFFVLTLVILPLPWVVQLLAKTGLRPMFLLAPFWICFLAIPVYALVSARRFYNQGWLKTLIKFVLLCAVYSMIVTLAMFAEVTVAMLFI
jgi:hypothetical protein